MPSNDPSTGIRLHKFQIFYMIILWLTHFSRTLEWGIIEKQLCSIWDSPRHPTKNRACQNFSFSHLVWQLLLCVPWHFSCSYDNFLTLTPNNMGASGICQSWLLKEHQENTIGIVKLSKKIHPGPRCGKNFWLIWLIFSYQYINTIYSYKNIKYSYEYIFTELGPSSCTLQTRGLSIFKHTWIASAYYLLLLAWLDTKLSWVCLRCYCI